MSLRSAPIGLLLALPALQACFYDSTWGAAKRAQTAAMARAAPAELRATPAAPAETEIPARKPVRTLKIRARATPRYAAEVVDWPRQLAELLEDASEILGPTLGLRVEIAETLAWVPRAGDDDLGALLDELAAEEPGPDVAWVLGLCGSLPRAEESFHQLGMGRVPGRHLVMRAMNDAREYEAIEKGFTEIDPAERRRLYRARKRHKAAAVFLHELGHTLGVPHQVLATTIMHGRYGPRVTGFSEGAATLMRLALDHRLEPLAQTERAFADAFAHEVERTSASWVDDEREALLARLRPAAPAPAAPAPSGRRRRFNAPDPTPDPAPAGPAEDPLAALSPADRQVYARAVEDQRAGRVPEALLGMKPLFSAYPDVLAVQDLRCQLAMASGGAWSSMQGECARLMELTRASAARKKGP